MDVVILTLLVVIIFYLRSIRNNLTSVYNVSVIKLFDDKFQGLERYRVTMIKNNKKVYGWAYVNETRNECYLYDEFFTDCDVGMIHISDRKLGTYFMRIDKIEFGEYCEVRDVELNYRQLFHY